MDYMLASQKIRAVGSLVTVVGLMMLYPAEAFAQAYLVLNPLGVDFGGQRINIQSDPTAFSVSNIGDDSATEISCSVALRPPFNSPSDPLSFTISSCPTTLAVGASFEINVWFTPYKVGPIGAGFQVGYQNGSGEEATNIDLDGTGFDAPDLFVNGDWSELSTGNQHISAGPTVPALEVPMENRHISLDLTITAFNVNGANCDQFIFNFPVAPFSLSAGAIDFFSAAFDPSVNGASSCDITFTSDDPDPPYTLTVTGMGIDSTQTCNINIVSGVTEYFDNSFEACEMLVLGPDFIAADGANVFASSGWEIDFLTGFLVEQGAALNANVCGQSLCMISPDPMPYGCHSCVDQICDSYPNCCGIGPPVLPEGFNADCLDKVDTVCGLVCE